MMHLNYSNKKSELEIYSSIPDCDLRKLNSEVSQNLLIQGDNLRVLKYLIEKKNLKGKIDLVYIDPPFSTSNSFMISEDRANTISSSMHGELAYSDKLKGEFFIEFLRERLVLIKHLLSEHGSIYLHIDYKIGHYVKVIMDEIFGAKNFRNDIARIKCNPKNFNRHGYSNIKDLILFYSKFDKMIWNEPIIHYSDKDIKKLFPKIDKKGRRYTTVPLHAPGETKKGKSSLPFKNILPPKGRHWRTSIEIMEKWDEKGLIEWSSTGNPRKKLFADEREGKRVQDVWEYKDPQYPVYPTEKNFELLDLIIKTSSNENSYVLDCFCGSGSTLKAAHINNRNWIGIDESEQAIKTTVKKLGTVEENLFIHLPEYEFYKVL